MNATEILIIAAQLIGGFAVFWWKLARGRRRSFGTQIPNITSCNRNDNRGLRNIGP